MKKFITLLVSTTLMATPVAFAETMQPEAVATPDQVMQQMPGNDANAASDESATPAPAAAEQKPVHKKHHVKHKKAHHKHHHKAAPAPTTDGGAVQ